MSERRHGGAALTIERRIDGIAVIVWVEAAAPDGGRNASCMEGELEAGLDDLLGWTALEGLVFATIGSGKEVAGAVLAELRGLRSAAEGAAVARRTQALALRIASFPVPSVAAVQGPCRGRALAFALAADARIASGDLLTCFALPEIRLGLVPSGGVTVRLPRLVGVDAALHLLLSGREVSPASAHRIGLLNRLSTPEGLVDDAVALAASLRDSPPERRSSRAASIARMRHLLFARNPIGRALHFRREMARAGARTRGNYPAPKRLLEVVQGGLARGFEAGLALEAQAFGELAMSAESKSLVSLFAAREELTRGSEGSLESSTASTLETVGILGAGPTGAGIAYVSAMHAGVEVRLTGRDAAARERGIARVRGVLDERVRRDRLARAARDAVLHRVRSVSAGERLKGVDLVIDAEPGSLEDKRRTIAGLQGFEAGRVIYASGLVPYSIASLASSCPHPENVLGMRYSLPVARMPLLEVVAGEESSPRALATCVDLGRRQGKTVIVVRDGPAFYCARILAPFLNEALWQLAEGLSIESIEWALVDFGFPIGPFARLDDLGIDVGAAVNRVLHDALGERMRPPPAMAKMVADGRFGRRAGGGFYNYEVRGKERRGAVDGAVYTTVQSWPAVSRPAADIAQRCVLAMINEAAHCLGEGVIRSARDGDVGAAFGVGFPAFLGGPFHYVDSLGAAYVVDLLESWAAVHGQRFRPAPLLAEMAGKTGRFYPEGD